MHILTIHCRTGSSEKMIGMHTALGHKFPAGLPASLIGQARHDNEPWFNIRRQ